MQKHIGLAPIVFVAAAVLAFGGTEPLLFAGVQLALFLLCALAVWASGAEGSRLPWKGPLLLFGYVLVQSLAVHPNHHLTQEQLARLITYLCVFYLTVLASRSGETQRRLVVALISLGLFEALYGLVQYLAGFQHIFGYQRVFYLDRASGTYINPNHFAGFLEMVLPLTLGYTVYRLGRLRRVGSGSSGTAQGRAGSEGGARVLLSLFVSLLIFLGILASGSRMGIFSAVVALAAMALLWASTSWRRRTALVVLVTFLLSATLLGFWVGMEPVMERYETTEEAYRARLGIWKDTVSLIEEHPLFGTGLGTFMDFYPQSQSQFLTRVVNHAHNDYLEFTLELGLVGVGLLFGLIVFVLVKGISAFLQSAPSWEKFMLWGACGSVIAMLFHSLADFNLYIPANAMVLTVILGLLYSLSKTRSRNRLDGRS